jgi:ribonuclease HII
MMHKLLHKSERVRFSKNTLERKYWDMGQTVCGIDEVGRGCLAGPLVTAAVILPIGKTSPLLKDSKLLTETERLKAAAWITKHCVYGVGIVHHRLIDTHNIWHATLIAMKRALTHVAAAAKNSPGAILVDAMPLSLATTSFHAVPVHHFPKGESWSSSIAAASIIAKVKRDEMMNTLDALFPGYYLESNKGYSTRNHLDALAQRPPSIIHRTSFKPKSLVKKETNDHDEELNQQRLC